MATAIFEAVCTQPGTTRTFDGKNGSFTRASAKVMERDEHGRNYVWITSTADGADQQAIAGLSTDDQITFEGRYNVRWDKNSRREYVDVQVLRVLSVTKYRADHGHAADDIAQDEALATAKGRRSRKGA